MRCTRRIFKCCEVLIENSITMITVRHHEAFRVTRVKEISICTKKPLWILFLTYLLTESTSNQGILLLKTHFARLSPLFLRQLHLDSNMCCFINLTLKFFDQETFCTAPLLYTDVETFDGNGQENDVST